MPQIKLVESPHETLNPGQSTYEVDPKGFQATCPAGYTVLGTGFNAGGIGTIGFVESFANFVGGFISNSSSVQISVFLQGICGLVPGGAVSASAHQGGEFRYHAMLKKVAARS